jgi:hypothetical protein
MTNRELLKEAIADAKAVKEVAITNAKAALEEAFTPHLKSMLEKKLTEMEEEDPYMEEAKHEDADSMEEIDLEELLRELEDESEEETEEMPNGEEETEEEEEIDFDNMTAEDLEAFIASVVDEMIEAGELEAGPSSEETPEMDMDMDTEEAPLEEPMMENKLNETAVSEAIQMIIDMGLTDNAHTAQGILGAAVAAATAAGGFTAGAIKSYLGKLKAKVGMTEAADGNAEVVNALEDASDAELAKLAALAQKAKGTMKEGGLKEDVTSFGMQGAEMLKYVGIVLSALGVAGAAGFMKASAAEKKEMLKKAAEKAKQENSGELEEAFDVINTLKSELNEVNLLNSKLLYTNKIFKAKNLSEAQKVQVLAAFDNAETVKETKLVYETLNAGLNKSSKKELVRENKSFASKTISGTSKQPVVETNAMIERFQILAGLNKK